MQEAYIVQALRTAGGRRNGKLSGWHPADLAGEVLDALVDRSGIDPAAIDDVVFGCVSQVGEQSFHIGRNAILASKLPDSVPAVSIDRQCGSSQQALHFAAQAVLSGTQDVVIAAGVESMSRVPMGAPTRLAVEAGLGGPWSERIQRAYGVTEFSQFAGARMLVDKYGFTRDDLDAYALRSHRRAAAATQAGVFDGEIVAVAGRDGSPHATDEGIRFGASPESIAAVKPLEEGGAITAANASQMCDGAAGLLVVSEHALKVHGLTPLARVHHMTVLGGDPVIMLETPIPATRRALERSGLKLDDIDLYEVNEAFASVALSWQHALDADPERLNVNGGAIALGHPLGATGAKLMATLVHALRARGRRYGLQAMCEGGGLANVTIVEAL
ncbi:acetyl-CoA C-acetyltransferase [Luteimonas sp. BDR2-5]|uniref:acetyl-CoA C-acetyltransferase n=1 Tax=Proluteimonas luteida TaxID=2878685 RepID=UPI001E31D192|nr:acetyl-CoA C-acetyltransferase [Luteimonas sp. BDR2-5]MCD9029739.1 acetyl-CoA C-acetyltransferase [Luteimonas sp. BDR2-5]